RLGDGLIDIPRDNVRAAGGTLKSKLFADHVFRMAPVHSEFGACMTDRDQIADVRIKKPGVRFQSLQGEIVAEAGQIAYPERGAVLPRAGEARAVVIDVAVEGVRDPLFRGEL